MLEGVLLVPKNVRCVGSANVCCSFDHCTTITTLESTSTRPARDTTPFRVICDLRSALPASVTGANHPNKPAIFAANCPKFVPISTMTPVMPHATVSVMLPIAPRRSFPLPRDGIRSWQLQRSVLCKSLFSGKQLHRDRAVCCVNNSTNWRVPLHGCPAFTSQYERPTTASD